jgi:hypothetical protein
MFAQVHVVSDLPYHSTVNMSCYQYGHTVHSNSADSAAAHREYLYFIQNVPRLLLPPRTTSSFQIQLLSTVRITELASSAQNNLLSRSYIANMPFPTDDKIMETAKGLVAQLQDIFGSHPGFRPGQLFLFRVKHPD